MNLSDARETILKNIKIIIENTKFFLEQKTYIKVKNQILKAMQSFNNELLLVKNKNSYDKNLIFLKNIIDLYSIVN